MKKGLLTIIIIALITLSLGVGVFLLLSPRSSDESGDISIATTTTTTLISSNEEYDEETSEDTEDSDGVVYIGGEDVATVPDVTLGDSEVYTISDSDSEDVSDMNTESSNGSEDTNESSNDTDETGNVTDIEKQPLNVTVTNKDYRIWSVFWVTSTAQTGYVNYGTTVNVQDRTAYDDRDTSEADMVEWYTHHVTITNDESEIMNDEPTYYFNIVSGGIEFYDYSFPYEYENVTLTSSPSTPNSISVTVDEVAGFDRNDYVVLAKMIDSNGIESTVVSDVFNSSGGVDLSIGIARMQSLESYFPHTSSNDISVKIYAPNGYTGFAESVSLSELSNEILNVQVTQTGYEGSIFSTSGSGDYSFSDRYPSADTTGESEESLPQTGVENEWAFTSIFGFVIFLLGTFCVLLFIPWNYKKLWEKKVIGEIDDMD